MTDHSDEHDDLNPYTWDQMDAHSKPLNTRIKAAHNHSGNSSKNTEAFDRSEKIRALNDQLRQTGEGGLVLMTPGIQNLEPDMLALCVRQLRQFEAFSDANDPAHEHDFGSFECEGNVIFFKIDYYDLDLTHHSPDPADKSVTKRVLTLMLASEY